MEPYILELDLTVTCQHVLNYRVYFNEPYQSRTSRFPLSALFSNHPLWEKIGEVSLTLWFITDDSDTGAVPQNTCSDDALPSSLFLAMEQLLSRLEHFPARCFTLTYMTLSVLEEDLPNFIPVVHQLVQLFQQSPFLQNIQELHLNDYFEQYPTVFSLPNLTKLYLSWDFDIDWNSLRQWQAPNLQTLWLNGVKNFTDVPDIIQVFPKLEKLYMKSQRCSNSLFYAPPYKGLHIPAQLKECDIENAEILEWEKWKKQ